MSSYLIRFKASAIVACLDMFERSCTDERRRDVDEGEFDDLMLRRLMKDFRENQSNGHLDTDLNTAWITFRADYEAEPSSALGSARSLRSLLLEKYAPNQRIIFYEDSNTIVLDGRPFNGFAPEQFQILKYLQERGPSNWTPVWQMIVDIESLRDVSERTVRRYINDPDLCPEIRSLIEDQPARGHRLVLPSVPVHAAE